MLLHNRFPQTFKKSTKSLTELAALPRVQVRSGLDGLVDESRIQELSEWLNKRKGYIYSLNNKLIDGNHTLVTVERGLVPMDKVEVYEGYCSQQDYTLILCFVNSVSHSGGYRPNAGDDLRKRCKKLIDECRRIDTVGESFSIVTSVGSFSTKEIMDSFLVPKSTLCRWISARKAEIEKARAAVDGASATVPDATAPEPVKDADPEPPIESSMKTILNNLKLSELEAVRKWIAWRKKNI